MLNPFYWYSCIWTFVLVLYGLGYSAINQPLTLQLALFLILTILISEIIGFLCRDIFQYRSLEDKPQITNTLTLVTVVFIIMDLLYTKQIPFLSIIRGVSQYGNDEIMGMPIVHTLLTNWIIVYCSYLYYVFLETQSKNILFKIIAQLSFFLLFFQKGMIIVVLFIFFNLSIAKLRKKRKVFNFKNLFIICISILVIMYLNGILANIRSGSLWNDNYYIKTVAQITNWPKWIPGQYIWTYTYITTPLGNLNQLLITFDGTFNLGNLILSVIPALISNQFVTSTADFNILDSKLTVKYLNASSGFMDAVNAGGIVGICLFYIAIVIIILFLTWYLFKKKKYSTPMYALLSMLISWCFFYDTFSAAATSLIPLLIIIFCKVDNIKFKFNKG